MAEAENNFFIEEFAPGVLISYRLRRKLYEGHSPHQRISVAEIDGLGKSIFLNGILQSSEIDEQMYHEILVHPAFHFHPNPEKVLIVGGGEGATLREVLKYPVKKVVMVEIDGLVVEVSTKYLPEWSRGSFKDPRVELILDDARKYVENSGEKFDLIISDLTDPFQDSLSAASFSREFYGLCRNNILKEDGIIAIQAGSIDPYFKKFFLEVEKNVRESFEFVTGYGSYIFSFFSLWGFLLASNKDYFSRGINKNKNVKSDFFQPELFEFFSKQLQIYLNVGVK